MATLNLQVGASAGDSQMGSITNDSGKNVTTAATVSTSTTLLQPGSHGSNNEHTAACRFTGVTIAQGATINSASFKMTADSTYNAGGNVIRYYVSCQAADNAGALTTTSGDLRVSIRARTTADATWTQTSVTGGVEQSISITSAVQEVINRAGWASGNAIVVLVDTHPDCTQGEWQDYRAYDTSSTTAPKLDIDYSTGGGAQTVNANAISSGAAVYQPTVTAGAVTVSPNLIASGATLYAPAVTPGAVAIAPTLIGSTGTVYAPSVAQGAITINPNAIASGETHYPPAVTPGAVTITLNLLASAETVYQPVVTTGQAIAPDLIASAATVYAPALTVGAVTISPNLLASSATVYAPAVSTGSVDYEIAVGSGYTDVSPKQLVRTSGNVLYVCASDCDSYPCTDIAQTLRMYKADSVGIPTGFTRMDSAGESSNIAQWAIAIDSNDVIHVAWTRRTSNGATPTSIRYNTFDTATDTWGTEATIETTTLSGGGQGDQAVAIVVDSSDIPHVCYLKSDGTRRRLYYNHRTGGSWTTAILVDDQSFGTNEQIWTPNLSFDYDNRLLFAWVRGTFNDTGDGTLFTRTRTSGAFDTTVQVAIDTHVGIDQSSSILITTDNRYHITWISERTGGDYSTECIRYAYSDDDGATWTANHPGSGNQATHNPVLGWAGSAVRILGHGAQDSGTNHGEDLYYFEGDGGNAAWGTWTKFVEGNNYDSSINTRWSRYHWLFPNTFDIAYWNDNYPNNLYVGTEIFSSDINPNLIASSATVYQPTVTPGAVTIAPNAISSSETHYPPALSVGAVTVSANLIASGATVYDPSVANGLMIFANAIASGETHHSPTVTPGAVTVSPNVISSGAAVYQPAITSVVVVAVNAIASSETHYPPAISAGAVTVALTAIASTAQVYAPALTTGAVTVSANAIASGEVHYPPLVQIVTGQTVNANAVASGSTIYLILVSLFTASAERTYTVAAEDRSFVIGAENRTYTIQ